MDAKCSHAVVSCKSEICKVSAISTLLEYTVCNLVVKLAIGTFLESSHQPAGSGASLVFAMTVNSRLVIVPFHAVCLRLKCVPQFRVELLCDFLRTYFALLDPVFLTSLSHSKSSYPTCPVAVCSRIWPLRSQNFLPNVVSPLPPTRPQSVLLFVRPPLHYLILLQHLVPWRALPNGSA